MIKTIKLKNVATYDSEIGTEISNLTKINFIYGANGSGKTTLSNFIANLSKWSNRRLTLLYLPPYSPQLNIIEILWKFMKYYRIEYTAYLSYDNLLKYIKKIFDNYGTKEDEYFINFNTLEEQLLETKLLCLKSI